MFLTRNAISVVAVTGLVLYICQANVCYIGQQPDPSRSYELRWVLPYTRGVRCQCTRILFGGLNVNVPQGAKSHFYTDQPLLFVNNHDVNSLRELLGCGNSDDTNECNSSPCVNGGTCEDGIGIFNCTCPIGYVGDKCQNDTNECNSSPCENGGTCEDGIGFFTCTCPIGYVGDTCQNDTNECDPNPCENGGTCVDGIGIYTCKFPIGYVDEKCQNDTNECDPNPCENGETCKDGIGFVSCTCPFGYIGVPCQNDAEAPVFMLRPTNHPKHIDSEDRTTNVTWADLEATDNSGLNVTVTCKIESPAQFTIGPTNILCEAPDASENKTRCTFTVNITACFDYLGMKNGDIPDRNIAASNQNHLAARTRLEGNTHWSLTGNFKKPWIQADIGYQTFITGVVTQGEGGNDQQKDWVTAFSVSTALINSGEFDVLKEGSSTKVFNANTDVDSKVENRFPQPVYARVLRITLESRHGNVWAMRFELLGCKKK